MKVFSHSFQRFQRAGLALMALSVVHLAPAQLTPNWTVNHGQAVPAAMARMTYFNAPDLTSAVLMTETPVIDYDWSFNSPDVGVSPDRFSVRWTGTIAPKVSETYTFFVASDDG